MVTHWSSPLKEVAMTASSKKYDIERAVMAGLGLPDRYSHTVVRRLWPNHYRVNVYCYTGEQGFVKKRKICHSYFVTSKKGVLTFDPPLV